MGFYKLNSVNQETGEVLKEIDLEIRAYPIADPKGAVKGYASVTIDGMFGAHGLSVVEGKNGLFVSMPQTRDGNTYRDIFHPVTSEGRKELNGMVLSEYSFALGELEAKLESTRAKIQEAKKAASERPAPDKATAKPQSKGRTKPDAEH